MTDNAAARNAPPPIELDRLRKRADFQRVSRRGRRSAGPAFLLLGAPRADGEAATRIGYTVTKKMGSAVMRNRIKRRLRAAVADVFPGAAAPGWDYVVIARKGACDRTWPALLDDMTRALISLRRNST